MNLSILTQKNCFLALGNMIRVVIPDPDPDFLPIPDLGVKKCTGSQIRGAVTRLGSNHKIPNAPTRPNLTRPILTRPIVKNLNVYCLQLGIFMIRNFVIRNSVH